jgi:hypothetical protein
MKRNVMTGILTTLTLLLLISVPNTYAQTTVKVTVPFNFTVGKAEMPAGTYTISRLSSSVIEIKGSTTKKSVVSIVRSEGASSSDSTAKLVFNQYGDSYFLSQVSRGYGADVMQLTTSKLEQEQRMASTSGASGQKVVVARAQK